MSSIAAGTIFEIGSIDITNTMIAGIATALIMIILAICVRLSLSIRPNSLQSFVEIMYEYFYDLCETISDKHRAKLFFPIIFTFFVFIVIGNYMGLLPFFGESIIYKPHTNEETTHEATLNKTESTETEEEEIEYPLLRGVTTDLNYTFAFALISFICIVSFGVVMQKPPVIGLFLHYFQAGELKKMEKGMRFGMLPMFVFVGILEIFLEPLKSISLSFRLFGNVYAGEALINAMTTIAGGNPTPFIAIPFYLLEFLVAFIQALVFALLTLVFLNLVTSKH